MKKLSINSFSKLTETDLKYLHSRLLNGKIKNIKILLNIELIKNINLTKECKNYNSFKKLLTNQNIIIKENIDHTKDIIIGFNDL